MKKLVSITILFFLFQFAITAQTKRKVEYSGFFDSYYYRGPLNITLGAGTAGYIGDLGFMPGAKLSPAFNIGGSYMVWPRTYFGGEFQYLTVGGLKNDSSGSISFNTNIYEIVAYGRFNLVDKRILFKNDISKRPPRVRPYITLGIGAVYYDPKVTVTDTNFFKNYEAVKATNVTFILPASLGFAFYISKRFSVLTEFGYRYTFTDNLDGINKIGNTGKDSYVTASLKIQYTFHRFKRKRAKYVPPVETGSSGSRGSGSGDKPAPAKRDSTLNDPILPPGAPEPAPTDSTGGTGTGTGTGEITPPPVEAPKEPTEEEKRKAQEEKEQLEWENSAKPKPAAQPADKKKTTAKPKPAPKPEETGW